METLLTEVVKVPCLCGVTHKTAKKCEKAIRIKANREHQAALLALLRELPENTITVHDTRTGKTGRNTARTLSEAEHYLGIYADGCNDREWGSEVTTADGITIRFSADDGGSVPNSYGYVAHADRLLVIAAEQRVLVMLDRVKARTSSYGRAGKVDQLPSVERVARVAGSKFKLQGPTVLTNSKEGCR